MPQADTFDDQWGAAMGGTLEPPAQAVVATDPVAAPVTEASVQAASEPRQAQVATQPAAAPATTPDTQVEGAFVLPDHLQQRLREVGAKDLDELFQFGRGFQSVRGQLPNLEAKWKKQHLDPVMAERDRLLRQEQAAIEDFVRVDPQTGRARTPQEQEAVRARIAQQRQEEQQVQQASQRETQLTEREQRVVAAEDAVLRNAASQTIPMYKQDLARQTGVPVAEIDTYIQQTNFLDRVKNMPQVEMFGSLLVELGNFAEVRAHQLQQQKLQQADTRYRDVGGNSGAGGQQAGHRWDAVSNDDFDKSWEAALEGRLV